jgi:hypothetical protein
MRTPARPASPVVRSGQAAARIAALLGIARRAAAAALAISATPRLREG